MEKPATFNRTAQIGRQSPGEQKGFDSFAIDGLLLQFLAELKNRDIPYCVLRNFEEIPESIKGDIDLLVKAEDIDRVEMVVKGLSKNFLLMKKIEKHGHVQFKIAALGDLEKACRENGKAKSILLDFITEFQWKGIKYLNAGDVLACREIYGSMYVPKNYHMVAALICHAILDKKSVKLKYKRQISEFLAEKGEQGLIELVPFIGISMVEQLYSAWVAGSDKEILKLRKKLALGLLLRKPSSVLSFSVCGLKNYIRILRAILLPPGVLIATAGPDGSGKTTLLSRVGKVLDEIFVPIKEQYMGWKNFILPTKRILRLLQKALVRVEKENASSNGSASLNTLSWTHNFSIIHYFMDLWARYILQIRPALMRGGLVFCDRYFFDFLVHNVWICKNRFTRFVFLGLTPKPSITIVLEGDPNTIAVRKQEVSASETSRQMAEFSVLKEKMKHILELDATGNLEQNTIKVIRTISNAAVRQGLR